MKDVRKMGKKQTPPPPFYFKLRGCVCVSRGGGWSGSPILMRTLRIGSSTFWGGFHLLFQKLQRGSVHENFF